MKIRSIQTTEAEISKAIKTRDQNESEVYKEIIKGYQVLIKRFKESTGTNNSLRQSLMSGLAPASGSSNPANTEKIHKLNEDLRETYKKLTTANETVNKLEKENEVLTEQNTTFGKENESMKFVLSDLKEKVEIRTKELNACKAENEMMNGKIKELQEDNNLYFKKIVQLQEEVVQKMNAANQLYDEATQIKNNTILKEHGESGISDMVKPGLDLGAMINDDYFKIPSKTRHKLFAHSKEAMCLTYTSQGSNIASGGGDGVIKIWDVEQGKEYGSLARQKKSITCLKFSPDDQFLASCSLDRTIKLWKISTMREAISFSGHSDNINSCSFSYAAKKLITASTDRTIRLWDYAKGMATKTFPCTSACYTIDNLPAETEIISGHLDGTLRIW